MLFVPQSAERYGLVTPSWGTTRPAAANGTSITPVTTNAYGTAVRLGNALTADAWGILININSNSGSAASRNSVIQLMVDPAGGTAYTAVLTGLLCGGAAPYTLGGGMWYYFPYFINSGATIAVAGRGSVVTAFTVGCEVYQTPENAQNMRRGSFFETLGITVGAGTAVGVTVVPGTTSVGAWTAIGTTTNPLWWWQFGLQMPVGDTSWAAATLHVDIGFGSATTPDIIISDAIFTYDATEQAIKPELSGGCAYDVPGGSTIYARIQNSGVLETGNYTIGVYGMGG
jgi:hypothetical protein